MEKYPYNPKSPARGLGFQQGPITPLTSAGKQGAEASETNHAGILDWPKEPRTLPTRSALWKEILPIILDVFIMLLPLSFLLIAILKYFFSSTR